MSFFNYLLISVLLVSNIDPVILNFEAQEGCKSLTVEQKINEGQNGKFTLTLTPKGGTAPYSIFIWSENGDLLNEKGTEREFKNLGSGKYEGVIGDATRCGKKFEIIIRNQ